MLSIGKIALGQHRYYEQQVAHGADDYYSGRGEAPGEWLGAGAAALGLAGRVSRGQFNALIAGRDPRAPTIRLRTASRDPAVAAFDLTFSAPKSISVLHALAPRETAAALVGVPRGGGARGARVPGGHGGVGAPRPRRRAGRARRGPARGGLPASDEPRAGPAAAHARRRGEPGARPGRALHGAAWRAAVPGGEDGGLPLPGAPAGARHASVSAWSGARSATARPSCSRCGAPVLEHFSKRRQEMVREAQAGGIGLGSKAGAEAAAIATRDRKQYGIDTHTWREEVAARAGELGLGAGEIAELLRSGRERLALGLAAASHVDEQALGDRLASAAGLTERANTFDERAVLQEFAAGRAARRVGERRTRPGRSLHRA